MRYEIHKFFENKDHPEKSAWAFQEIFPDTDSGFEDAMRALEEIRTYDKKRPVALFFVERTKLPY